MMLRALFLRYTAFAVVATVANLALQRAVMELGKTGGHFAAAVCTGPIVGLAIKYLLDKRWIFIDLKGGMKNHSLKFSLYTAMGLVTTADFLGLRKRVLAAGADQHHARTGRNHGA